MALREWRLSVVARAPATECHRMPSAAAARAASGDRPIADRDDAVNRKIAGPATIRSSDVSRS